jgi:uncharacterized membrane protein
MTGDPNVVSGIHMVRELNQTRRSFLVPPSLDQGTLVTFSDGIFTIAITLLILEIRLPDIASIDIDARFLESLMTISPKILGFILSFFIIAMYWLSYHRIFYFIRKSDRVLMFDNILFLFFIVFLSFPTYLIGLYGSHQTIVLFYAATIFVTSALLALIWRHASMNHLLVDPDLDVTAIRYLWTRSLIPVVIFLLSIGVAIFNPLMAMVLWGLNFVVIALMERRLPYSSGTG